MKYDALAEIALAGQALTEEQCQGVLDSPDEDVLAVLTAREELSSTGLECGVAIPHGKMAGMDHVVACFGRSVAGIDFAALDGHPTHLFFLLIAPDHSTSEHLRALTRVARLMKNETLRDALLAADDDEAVFQLLMAADAELG